jgi:hypothetical protein
MKKGKPRPVTPFGMWMKTQSLQKEIELRTIAETLGILPQNLSKKIHGERSFSDRDVARIEKIFGEKYSGSRSV